MVWLHRALQERLIPSTKRSPEVIKRSWDAIRRALVPKKQAGGEGQQLSPLVKKILPRSWSHVYSCIQLQYTVYPYLSGTTFRGDRTPSRFGFKFSAWFGWLAPVLHPFCISLLRFYQWSNDNYVYTELAHPGLHEVNDALFVFFATESPPLDNSLAGRVMNVPRNVARTAEATARKFASGRPKNLL